MKIRMTGDSTCDLSPELLRKYDFRMAPLSVIIDGTVFHDGVDVTPRDIFRAVEAGKSVRTAAVNAYEYKGECWLIDSVQSYFRFNMDILDTKMRKGLFREDLPVFTKVRDEMPACYGDNATIINSLVADGCQIEGTVENSVLFRGVKVAPEAHVKNCIIMQDGQVHEAAYIENCILDKQSIIKRNARLIGPEAYPIVIGKDVVI